MKKFIVAGSFAQAKATACVDWGWKQGPGGFVDGEGDAVWYAAGAQQLRGVRGAVYCAYGFEQKADLVKQLVHLLQIGAIRILPAPNAPERPLSLPGA